MRLRHLTLICLGISLLQCGSENRRFLKAKLKAQPAADAPAIDYSNALTIDSERVALTKAYFQEHNQALFKTLPSADNLNSIRFTPRMVVVHFTAIETLEKTLAYFKPNTIASNRGLVASSGALNVGIQFVVDRDGTIYSSYPDNVMSRHVIGLNHVAIGIENVGNADMGTKESETNVPLTKAQLDANVALIRYLAHKYTTIAYVIGHYEYQDLEDPNHPAHGLFAEDQPNYRTDKVDPGTKFMAALRKRLNGKK